MRSNWADSDAGRVLGIYNRAATAVVQGERHLEKALEELRLAVTILSELSRSGEMGSLHASRLLAVVQEYLARLEAVDLDGIRSRAPR
jgi:hypothetical protein